MSKDRTNDQSPMAQSSEQGGEGEALPDVQIKDAQILEFCGEAGKYIGNLLKRTPLQSSPLPILPTTNSAKVRLAASVADDVMMAANKLPDVSPEFFDCCSSCYPKYKACRAAGGSHQVCWDTVYRPCKDAPCDPGC